MRQFSRFHGLPAASAVMAGAILLAGCATTTAPPMPTVGRPATEVPTPAREPAVLSVAPDDPVPVVRYGRYTLLELQPQPAQRDLMRQVVEITIPHAADANVGDALRHVLLRSGYRLCEAPDASALYAFALPAAHLHLGPLMLRDALQTLAGPAWDLAVDDGARLVFFTRRVAAPVSVSPPVDAAGAAPNADRASTAEEREVRQ